VSILAQIVIAGLIFIAGAAGGVRWHAGQDAIAAQAAQEARETDARQQRHFNDGAAGKHAAQLATLNDKLGDARAQIARLSGRSCLDAGTVGVLNDTGLPGDNGAAAGKPAGAASAAAPGPDDRVATDVDVAGYIALCRTRYGEVESQLNQILDREDRRAAP
jgi:hypothetical protein